MGNFSIGTDSEFFVKNANRKFISAIPFIEGTKSNPQLLSKGNVQRDNVSLEIATDPANDIKSFVENIETTLTEAITVLPKDTKLIATPFADFEEDQLEHPEAKMAGCDPDYDAWELAENTAKGLEDITFRSCGAHIHVGTNGEDGNEFLLGFDGKIDMVKTMDCVHGLISTVLDSTEESLKRRELYGNPGAHRPKDYGVEYRVLSNFWLKSPVTVMLMYYLTEDALTIVKEGKTLNLIDSLGGEEEIKRVIREGDNKVATKLIEDHVIPLLNENSIYYFQEALAKLEIDDMDFHKEWGLYK